MARDTKGSMVSSYKTSIPQPDQTSVEQITKVYFQGEFFYIYLPEHIAEAIKSGYDGLGSNSFGSYIRDRQIAEVKDDFGSICERYLALIQSQGAVKVIRYKFQAKHAGMPVFGSEYTFEHGANLGPGVAMLLDYEVLWRSGTRLFYGHYEDGELRLQDKGPVPNPALSWQKDRLIEWTEEREAFFEGMKKGLIGLIDRLIQFCDGDVAEQIGQIMSGEARMPLLAAPKTEDA